MANFLMPNGITESHVNDEAHVDPDVAPVGTIAVRRGPIGDIAAGASVIVTNYGDDSVSFLNPDTLGVEDTIAVPGEPFAAVVSDDRAFVLTSDRVRGGAVSVMDMSSNRITDTIELGIGAPTQMTLSTDKTRAYVVDYDHVAVLCTLSHEVVNTVTVDARPSCVAVNYDGGRLYVADYAGDVSAFSIASALPLLYSQLVATDAFALPVELEPATA